MKKKLGLYLVALVLVLVGCGAKSETTTFSQTAMPGADTSIEVTHKGDKVTDVSAKVVFNNETMQITDEAIADQMAEAFESTSELKNAKVKYTKEETIITYDAPAEYVKSGSSYKDAEKSLTEVGFTKK